MGKYRTKQRESILEYLKCHEGEYLTPDEIAAALENVGRSTVYRALESLAEEGTVRRFAGEAGRSACFQYIEKTSPCHRHFHLKCLSCGKIIHLDCEALEECERHILEEHGFELDNARTLIYGRCEECKGKEPKE